LKLKYFEHRPIKVARSGSDTKPLHDKVY